MGNVCINHYIEINESGDRVEVEIDIINDFGSTRRVFVEKEFIKFYAFP